MLEDRSSATAGPSGGGSSSRTLLTRLADAWPRRAYVKKQELVPFFEDGKEDFLESLLPFRDVPQYQACSPELRSRVLSCGWLIYNAKTVQIETDIVNPACLSILRRELPGLHDGASARAVCETMVDEAYHVHLVERASWLTREHRGLEHVVVPRFNLVRHMQRRQSACSEPWERRLVQFATAVVSEIFISDYLQLLSESDGVQPFNRETVAAHRHDELAHSPLFRSLAQLLSAELAPAERAVFADLLPQPVVWFADRELDTWLSVLHQIDFPGADAMIRECRSAGQRDLASLDYSGVLALAEEVGVLDSAVRRESFSRLGLVPEQARRTG
jgi:alpha-N-dichloroacetyl-p-aminophenylserinol N-oxygenase